MDHSQRPQSTRGQHSESFPNEQEEAELRKWNLDDPFLYAPPKPEGDPWSLSLEPLLEEDKLRCDAWRDEVQNLLIFAGLFSAVVTAFIIESYKNLKPDPNDAIIGLLSHIAIRLENASSILPPTSPSNNGFAPTSSSIRVNTFWFVSLVLSLTTVLVGIVSLQWLREHQSYPNYLTPKQTYALFNMRAQGLRKWHIPKVFTLLPLLLQSALVLFLGGMIDFLLSFGGIVVIPVGAVVGSTIFFLIATTMLPAIQGFLLYLPFPYFGKQHPTQCPYKSPQSHAFLLVCSRLHSALRYIGQLFSHFATSWSIRVKKYRVRDCFSPYVLQAWEQKTWTEFDVAWLSIRDAYMRRAYGRATDLDNLGWQDPEQHTPLFDITRGLLATIQTQKYETQQPEFSFAAEYYCLVEISQSISSVWEIFGTFPDGFQLQNAYFQDLLSGGSDDHVCLSDFFRFSVFNERSSWEDLIHITSPFAQKTMAAFHHEAIFMFLRNIDRHHPMENLLRLSMHRLELKLRLMGHFYRETYELHPSAQNLQPPAFLNINADSEFSRLEMPKRDVFRLQLAYITKEYFKSVGNDMLHKGGGTLHTHRHIPHFLKNVFWVIWSSPDYDKPQEKVFHTRSVVFSDVFTLITEHLNQEMSIPPEEGQLLPSLLFYAAALYIRKRNRYGTRVYPSLQILLSTMRQYKQRTIALDIVDYQLETLFRQADSELMVKAVEVRKRRFTEDWWDSLLPPLDPEPVPLNDSDTHLRSCSMSIESSLSDLNKEPNHYTLLSTPSTNPPIISHTNVAAEPPGHSLNDLASHVPAASPRTLEFMEGQSRTSEEDGSSSQAKVEGDNIV